MGKKKTQGQIAVAAGMSEPYLSQILNGTRPNPSYRLAKILGRVTGTTAEVWADGTPPELRAAVMRYLQK